MIELYNLSPLQREICERLWNMDDQAEIQAWLDTLPRRMQATALGMMHLMLAELLDQEDLDLTVAGMVIDQARYGHD